MSDLVGRLRELAMCCGDARHVSLLHRARARLVELESQMKFLEDLFSECPGAQVMYCDESRTYVIDTDGCDPLRGEGKTLAAAIGDLRAEMKKAAD